MNRLSASTVASKRRAGKYHDGGGLHLKVQINTSGSITKSWLFRFYRGGREVWMGLGAIYDVSLADARAKARKCRDLLGEGKNPLLERNRDRMEARLAEARSVTFEDCAEAFLASHEAGWRNDKHRGQWRNTLETYAYPVIGKLPVAEIDVALVRRILDPIWYTKTETATRVRQRVEKVLDYASASQYRAGENPARWQGNLKELLPAAAKLKKVRNHPALPYAQIHSFVNVLRDQEGTAARALEFTILTAARTNEVIGARWSEIDFENALWTIPGDRMKAGKSHTVPLPPRGIAILKYLNDQDPKWVFPGLKDGNPLSNMAMLTLLKRMKRTELTVHGFRSTFRDWAAESTTYPAEVCEMALAHRISDTAEAAYRRGDLLEKRRRLMRDWQRFIETAPGTKSRVTSEGSSRRKQSHAASVKT